MMRLFVAVICLFHVQIALSAASSPTTNKPNFVFILTDDQRFDELGFMNPELSTPALDKLAEEGVHFKNAFVTTSLCSPSRASILTGRYAHSHGIVDNLARDFAPDTRFFAQDLQSAGYKTAFIGKWQMGRHKDDPQPGFEHWISFSGQGHYLPDPNTPLNINGEHVPQKGYITDELTDYAVDWLETIKKDDNFFLFLSHKAVHDNFTPADRHKKLYENVDIKLPASADDSKNKTSNKPMWVKNQRNSWHGLEFPYHSDLDVRDYKRKYHRAMAAVDESTARIRSVLKERGLDHNTIVIFMGDNGFMFGEHGLIDKRNAYEESMRVPLIVYSPLSETKPSNVEDMVANIDLAPTILDLAGVDVERKFHGRSFSDQLAGKTVDDWRQELLYEYYWEWVFPHTPTTFAIRTPTHKFIQYHGIWDTDELYDLENDPQERNNLISSPESKALARQLRKRIFELISETDGEHAVPYTMKQGPGLHYRLKRGSEAASFPEASHRTGTEKDIHRYKD